MSQGAKACARTILDVMPPLMRSIGTEIRRSGGAGLSMPQFHALGQIARNPGCSLTQVAESMGLALPATSKFVDALVQRELVCREPSPEDRRRIILNVTDHGRAVRQAVFDQARDYLARHLQQLTVDERKQIVDAMRLLEPVSARATAERAEGYLEKSSDNV